MQLISVGLARSIWLFDINDLNPTGESIFTDLFPWLGEKYSFQTFPKSISDLDQTKKGYLFKNGEFQTDENTIQVNLSIFGDGVVAETWASTEKGDMFLEEVLRSAASKYGLAVQADTILKKQYISEVTVRLNRSLGSFGDKMAGFCETLNGIFSRHRLPPFEMT